MACSIATGSDRSWSRDQLFDFRRIALRTIELFISKRLERYPFKFTTALKATELVYRHLPPPDYKLFSIMDLSVDLGTAPTC